MTVPNFISLLRMPLAFLFLKQDMATRALIIAVAMISDGLDGFLARKTQTASKVGTLLDPLMDRFFVFFVIGVFLKENQLSLFEAVALLCRDFSVLLFGCYLVVKGKLATYRFRAIWCGKATTFLQFIVFFIITFQIPFPPAFYLVFYFIGLLALLELYLSRKEILLRKSPRI